MVSRKHPPAQHCKSNLHTHQCMQSRWHRCIAYNYLPNRHADDCCLCCCWLCCRTVVERRRQVNALDAVDGVGSGSGTRLHMRVTIIFQKATAAGIAASVLIAGGEVNGGSTITVRPVPPQAEVQSRTITAPPQGQCLNTTIRPNINTAGTQLGQKINLAPLAGMEGAAKCRALCCSTAGDKFKSVGWNPLQRFE